MTWPDEPGYHWVTHNDSAVHHLAKAAEALNAEVPDTTRAQVHAGLAQAEATLVVVHTLRDIMGRIQEQTLAVENLRRAVAGRDGSADDTADTVIFARRADISPGV